MDREGRSVLDSRLSCLIHKTGVQVHGGTGVYTPLMWRYVWNHAFHQVLSVKYHRAMEAQSGQAVHLLTMSKPKLTKRAKHAELYDPCRDQAE